MGKIVRSETTRKHQQTVKKVYDLSIYLQSKGPNVKANI